MSIILWMPKLKVPVPSKPHGMIQSRFTAPFPSPGQFHRTKFIEKMNLNPAARIFIVCSPAGYGKSTAISQWVRTCDAPFAWLNAHNSFNDLPNFLEHVVGSIEHVFPNRMFESKNLIAGS